MAVALAIGLTGTAQAKTITGTPGNDRIHGSRQADVIDALAGDDRIGAGKGADVVNGGEGLDRIWGGWGADQLYGGPGDDRLWGGLGADQSWGEDGDDLMGGGHGDDKQYGGAGNDTIYAGRGRDETWGEDGDDTLWALARADVHGRNDTLGDTLHGGAGRRHVQDARRRGGRDRLRSRRRHRAAGLQGRDRGRDGAEPERVVRGRQPRATREEGRGSA